MTASQNTIIHCHNCVILMILENGRHDGRKMVRSLKVIENSFNSVFRAEVAIYMAVFSKVSGFHSCNK